MSKKLWGFLFVVIILCIVINYKNILKMLYPLQYENIVKKYSIEYKLDPNMVYALIRVESKFNPYAKSSKDASGLMQITATTGEYIARLIGDKNFEKDDLYKPEISIKYGCFYFSKLLKDFDGNINCAIAAYNGGEGNARRWAKRDSMGRRSLSVEDITFGETRQYVRKVSKYYDIYKFIYTKEYSGIPNFFK